MKKVEFRDFFYRLLGDQERRRVILEHWHRNYPVPKEATTLVDVFVHFIETLLYGKTDLCIRKDEFSILTGQWNARPLMIRKEWLTTGERAVLHKAVKQREDLFMSRKEYENGLYNYEGFVHNDQPDTKPYQCLVDRIWRRQLLRDFCFLLLAVPTGHAYLLDWLCAVQRVLVSKQGKSDAFLAAVHGALQGRYSMADVPCWGVKPWDYHSDIVKERDEEELAARPAKGSQKRKLDGAASDNGARVVSRKRSGHVCWEDQHKASLSSSAGAAALDEIGIVREFRNKKLLV